MSDNEDDVDSYVQGLDDTTYYSGSGSDEDDFGYDDNESGDGSSDDDYDEEVYYSTPASSVPRLCAQLSFDSWFVAMVIQKNDRTISPFF
jgi:hypothetical protein